eukprot:jgi/Mesvir1/13206/Mv06165-RA.1
MADVIDLCLDEGDETLAAVLLGPEIDRPSHLRANGGAGAGQPPVAVALRPNLRTLGGGNAGGLNGVGVGRGVGSRDPNKNTSSLATIKAARGNSTGGSDGQPADPALPRRRRVSHEEVLLSLDTLMAQGERHPNVRLPRSSIELVASATLHHPPAPPLSEEQLRALGRDLRLGRTVDQPPRVPLPVDLDAVVLLASRSRNSPPLGIPDRDLVPVEGSGVTKGSSMEEFSADAGVGSSVAAGAGASVGAGAGASLAAGAGASVAAGAEASVGAGTGANVAGRVLGTGSTGAPVGTVPMGPVLRAGEEPAHPPLCAAAHLAPVPEPVPVEMPSGRLVPSADAGGSGNAGGVGKSLGVEDDDDDDDDDIFDMRKNVTLTEEQMGANQSGSPVGLSTLGHKRNREDDHDAAKEDGDHAHGGSRARHGHPVAFPHRPRVHIIDDIDLSKVTVPASLLPAEPRDHHGDGGGRDGGVRGGGGVDGALEAPGEGDGDKGGGDADDRICDAPMSKIMESVKGKLGGAEIRLLFDDSAVKGSDTPESLGLEDGDMIDVRRAK